MPCSATAGAQKNPQVFKSGSYFAVIACVLLHIFEFWIQEATWPRDGHLLLSRRSTPARPPRRARTGICRSASTGRWQSRAAKLACGPARDCPRSALTQSAGTVHDSAGTLPRACRGAGVFPTCSEGGCLLPVVLVQPASCTRGLWSLPLRLHPLLRGLACFMGLSPAGLPSPESAGHCFCSTLLSISSRLVLFLVFCCNQHSPNAPKSEADTSSVGFSTTARSLEHGHASCESQPGSPAFFPLR